MVTMRAGAMGQQEEGVATPTSHQSVEFVTPQHWSSCMSRVSTSSFTIPGFWDHLLHIIPGLRDALIACLVVILQTIVHLSLDRVGEIRLTELRPLRKTKCKSLFTFKTKAAIEDPNWASRMTHIRKL